MNRMNVSSGVRDECGGLPRQRITLCGYVSRRGPAQLMHAMRPRARDTALAKAALVIFAEPRFVHGSKRGSGNRRALDRVQKRRRGAATSQGTCVHVQVACAMRIGAVSALLARAVLKERLTQASFVIVRVRPRALVPATALPNFEGSTQRARAPEPRAGERISRRILHRLLHGGWSVDPSARLRLWRLDSAGNILHGGLLCFVLGRRFSLACKQERVIQFGLARDGSTFAFATCLNGHDTQAYTQTAAATDLSIVSYSLQVASERALFQCVLAAINAFASRSACGYNCGFLVFVKLRYPTSCGTGCLQRPPRSAGFASCARSR